MSAYLKDVFIICVETIVKCKDYESFYTCHVQFVYKVWFA